MQAKRALLFVLMLLVLAAVGFLAFRSPDQVGPAPLVTAAAPGGTVDPATGELAGAHEAEPTAATAEASLERSKVPVVVADAGVPAIVGQLVDTNDNPVVGAEVVVGPGMAMAAMSGSFDFGNFDPADFADEALGFGPDQMAKLTAKQAAESARATSGPDGRFRVVPTGSSRGLGLRAIARGFTLLDRAVTRPADADVDLGVLHLEGGAVVAGRVVDPAGNGIEGAVVSRLLDIEKGPMGQFEIDTPEMQAAEQMRFGDTCTTDGAGRFELAHVPPGEFTLRARHPEHPTTRQSGEAAAGHTLGDLTITMPIGLEIRGTVVDLPAGKTKLRVMAAKKPDAAAANPLMGMLGGDPTELLGDMGMSFGERGAEVDASGNFVLRGLRQDTYRIWLSQVGVGFAGSTICSDKQEVAAGTHGVQLRYEAGVRVTFVVVDADSNQPIERLWVDDRLRGGDGFADIMAMGMPSNTRQQSYPGGAVTLANLRPKPKQKLSLVVNAIGHGEWQRADIELPRVGSLDLGTIRLAAKPVVQVTVIDADTGAPVVGATVKVVDGPSDGQQDVWRNMAGMVGNSGPQSGKTGADGVCVLNARVDAEACVQVDSKQHAPFLSDAIKFPAKGKTEVLARLLVGGTVEVAVVDLQGKPVVDAAVEHRDVSGSSRRGKTDAHGVARFVHLAPGTHRFQLGENVGAMASLLAAARPRAATATESADWQPVEVVDHGAAKLQLVKSPTATLRGVVRENGAPLAGARVTFVEGRGSESDSDVAQQMVGGMLEQFGGKGGRSAKTDDAGAFTIAELPEGEHRLRITHKERALPSTIDIVLRNGDNVQDIELDMTAARGIVSDPEGNPVSGARVSVRIIRAGASAADDLQDSIGSMMPFAAPSGVKTELDGSFTLRGVPPDVQVKIVASAKNFAPAQMLTTVPRGATTAPLQLRLGAAGRIKVNTTTDATMVMVTARFVGDGEGQAPVMQMLRKGKGTLSGLRPGKWEVEFNTMQRDETGAQKRTVEVVAGETVEVEF